MLCRPAAEEGTQCHLINTSGIAPSPKAILSNALDTVMPKRYFYFVFCRNSRWLRLHTHAMQYFCVLFYFSNDNVKLITLCIAVAPFAWIDVISMARVSGEACTVAPFAWIAVILMTRVHADASQ